MIARKKARCSASASARYGVPQRDSTFAQKRKNMRVRYFSFFRCFIAAFFACRHAFCPFFTPPPLLYCRFANISFCRLLRHFSLHYFIFIALPIFRCFHFAISPYFRLRFFQISGHFRFDDAARLCEAARLSACRESAYAMPFADIAIAFAMR
jgi:hypothetical protein